jgi:trk system potassium uptake protein TrkA
MKIIVVGCGRLGAELSYRLFRQGHEVTVVDDTAAAFNNLPADFRGRTIEGDALNQDVIHRAGFQHANALATVTNSDALNVVVAHVARSVFGLEIVVVRNYDPICRPLIEAFGMDVVSSTSWGAQRMEDILYHVDVRAVFSAGNGEVEIYEVIIPKTWDGKTLAEFLDCDRCLAISLSRAGRASLPQGDTKLVNGDVIYLSATLDGIQSLRRRLHLGEEA